MKVIIRKSKRSDIDLPLLDLLTFLFDSDWPLARDDTKLQIEAANPSNYITKAEARALTQRVAWILRSYGIGSPIPHGKDVVLIISSGSPFLPILFYGIVAAGGVFSGVSTALRTGEIVRQVKDADAKLLVCSPEYEALTIEVAKQCGIPAEKVLVQESRVRGQWTLIDQERADVIKAANGATLDWSRMADRQSLQDTTIALLYSSGTTGLPKGVRLSHWNVTSSCICTMDVARRYQNSHPDFVFDTIAHLPFANIAGIDMYCTNPTYMGGSTYWMKSYSFEDFVAYHKQFQPGYQFTVPPIWLRVAKSDWVTDHFDGLQVAVTGSAPIGYATVQEIRAKLGKGKAVVAQTWGITEFTGVVTAMDWGNDTWSVGDLCPNVQLRILDDDDQDIATDSQQTGEMLVGGPMVAQGYHNRSDATRESFVGGWYRSGDIGIYENGETYIVDRKKELIKYKGQQVAPAELEALLTSHSRIADAAVIGIWDDKIESEVPRAYVVPKQSDACNGLSAAAIMEFVKANLAAYKQLRGGVVFVDQIPKSASGKILRKDLREKAGESTKPKL